MFLDARRVPNHDVAFGRRVITQKLTVRHKRKRAAAAHAVFVDLIARESIEAYSAVRSLFVSQKRNGEKGESHESVYETAIRATFSRYVYTYPSGSVGLCVYLQIKMSIKSFVGKF